RGRGLDVELASLGKICLVTEIIRLEETGRTLPDRAGEDRRVDAYELTLVEEVDDRLLDLVAHTQDRPLLAGTQPQMAVVEEEIDAVFLGLDRVLLGEVDDLEILDGHLVPARCARVLADLARHPHARLLRERREGLPDRSGDLFLQQYPLHDPGPVAHHDEGDLAMRTCGLYPTPHGDGLAHVAREMSNVADHSHTFSGPPPPSDAAHRSAVKRNERRKVGTHRKGVNLSAHLAFLALVGCSGRAPLDPHHMVQPTSMDAAPAAPADSASIAWRREVGPSIFASPLIVGDAVVVATGDGRLTTFAARTGERRWS